MEMTAFFCENGWISQAAVKAGLEQASRMEWAEGTAELLHLQSKYLRSRKKNAIHLMIMVKMLRCC